MASRPTTPRPPPHLAAWNPPPEAEVEARLVRHLDHWLGRWPPQAPVEVVTGEGRRQPAWDGGPSRVVGVASPEGAVLSLPPDVLEKLGGPRTATSLEEITPALLRALGYARGRVFEGTYRWSASPGDYAPVGVWVPADDPRLADWLRPFGGEVLAAFTAEGHFAAGVGIKRHDDIGRELAVGTEEPYRGRRLARSLVAQAARRMLDEGCVPTYLHAPANRASAAVAEAAGFPDRGWRILGVVPG